VRKDWQNEPPRGGRGTFRRRLDAASASVLRAAGHRAQFFIRTTTALLFASALLAAAPEAAPNYTIQAIRYGTIQRFPLSALVMGASENEKIDIAMVV
jgi:hypothetical protein